MPFTRLLWGHRDRQTRIENVSPSHTQQNHPSLSESSVSISDLQELPQLCFKKSPALFLAGKTGACGSPQESPAAQPPPHCSQLRPPTDPHLEMDAGEVVASLRGPPLFRGPATGSGVLEGPAG